MRVFLNEITCKFEWLGGKIQSQGGWAQPTGGDAERINTDGNLVSYSEIWDMLDFGLAHHLLAFGLQDLN